LIDEDTEDIKKEVLMLGSFKQKPK